MTKVKKLTKVKDYFGKTISYFELFVEYTLSLNCLNLSYAFSNYAEFLRETTYRILSGKKRKLKLFCFSEDFTYWVFEHFLTEFQDSN